jgi:hypothetical protein
MRGLGWYLLAIASAVSGCGGPATPANTPPLVQQPVVAFDGSYRDTIRPTTMASEAVGTKWCDTPGQPTILVSNGQFNYAVPHPNVPGNPTPSFPATLTRDGSFSGTTNNGTISGRVDGSHIEGEIDGSGCNYLFSGDRM